MAQERIPNDPYRAGDPIRASEPTRAGDPTRAGHPDDPYRTNNLYRGKDGELRDPARLDDDPELAEGPASGGKVAMFAVAIALVLGAVFYGLNNSSINQAGTSSIAQNAPSSPPAAPPGMRDVTPRAPNTDPGVTTGATPSRQTPIGPPTSGADAGAPDNK
jgi:hypothetical protein